MLKKISFLLFFSIIFSIIGYSIYSMAENTSIVILEYYSNNVKIYNIIDKKTIPINNFSSFAKIIIKINGNKVRIQFSPVPIDIFRNYTIDILRNTLVININNLKNTSNITSVRDKMINNYLYNSTFIEIQYKYYLSNFTVNLSNFVILYNLTENGYTVEEPEMGLFTFYTPYIIDYDTIRKYRPVYYGCPITEENFGYTFERVPDSLLPLIDKDNLYKDNQLMLAMLDVYCYKPNIIKKSIYTTFKYRGNYLFSSDKIILKYGNYLILISMVEPAPGTLVFLSNLPVEYGRDNIGLAIVVGVVVVAGGVVYYFVRRKMS